MSEVWAAVAMGHDIELRSLPRPSIPADAGLLRVEAAGVCGADIANFARGSRTDVILGHENAGVIDEIGDTAAKRWGVEVGDRVLLEEYLPCWHCEWCHQGQYRLCYATDHRQNPGSLRFGRTPVDVLPSLWGGFSEFLYLPHNAVLHRIDPGVPTRHTALAMPLANGVQWARLDGGVGPGSTVVILGPGQQGLGCLIASLAGGATTAIVTGLADDARRLEAARKLGAHVTIDASSENVVDVVMEFTDGRGADCVVDTTSSSSGETTHTALALLKRKGGTAVLHGSGEQTIDGFPLGVVASKYATLRVTRGHSYRAVEDAIAIIESGRFDLDLVATTECGLTDVIDGLRMGASDRSTIHVTVNPWL
jgi:threonine dehydrogenase-like Zn-dependent dehydrogenase